MFLTRPRPLQVLVEADIVEPKTGTRDTTNVFSFTYSVPEQLTYVIPINLLLVCNFPAGSSSLTAAWFVTDERCDHAHTAKVSSICRARKRTNEHSRCAHSCLP